MNRKDSAINDKVFSKTENIGVLLSETIQKKNDKRVFGDALLMPFVGGIEAYFGIKMSERKNDSLAGFGPIKPSIRGFNIMTLRKQQRNNPLCVYLVIGSKWGKLSIKS